MHPPCLTRVFPRFVVAGLIAGAVAAAPLRAQAPAGPGGPVVGDVAPDFALPGATRYGLLQPQVRLSDYRGQVVVIAFFPKARTTGCTKQFESYRDQYAALFNNGRKVTVIGISTNADTTLASWAKEQDFPTVFASDTAGTVGRQYGAYNEAARMDSRYLYVVGPDGKIVYTDKPFNVSAPEAYAGMTNAIKARVSAP